MLRSRGPWSSLAAVLQDQCWIQLSSPAKMVMKSKSNFAIIHRNNMLMMARMIRMVSRLFLKRYLTLNMSTVWWRRICRQWLSTFQKVACRMSTYLWPPFAPFAQMFFLAFLKCDVEILNLLIAFCGFAWEDQCFLHFLKNFAAKFCHSWFLQFYKIHLLFFIKTLQT